MSIVEELRQEAAALLRNSEAEFSGLLTRAADEIERLGKELADAKRLPDSMAEAFNSGDGSYKP